MSSRRGAEVSHAAVEDARRVARVRPRVTARSGEHRLPGGNRAAGSGTRVSRGASPSERYGNEVKPPSVGPLSRRGRSGRLRGRREKWDAPGNMPEKKKKNVRQTRLWGIIV